jgi:hypothetical protein
MTKAKEEKSMGEAEAVTETITDMSAVLSLKQVHTYTDRMVERGHAEYNNGAILVKSKHPLDECLRRGIIDDVHYDVGKAFITIRECAFSRLKGRMYNDLGEGDSEIDAATLYSNTFRKMLKSHWRHVSLICFSDARPDGSFFSDADYSYLYGIAPNIQAAFEHLSEMLCETRKALKERIAQDHTTKQ